MYNYQDLSSTIQFASIEEIRVIAARVKLDRKKYSIIEYSYITLHLSTRIIELAKAKYSN